MLFIGTCLEKKLLGCMCSFTLNSVQAVDLNSFGSVSTFISLAPSTSASLYSHVYNHVKYGRKDSLGLGRSLSIFFSDCILLLLSKCYCAVYSKHGSTFAPDLTEVLMGGWSQALSSERKS